MANGGNRRSDQAANLPLEISQSEAAKMLNVFDESQRAVIASTLANMRQGQRTDIEPSANLRKVKSKKDSTFSSGQLAYRKTRP